jgi:tricorn protease
MVATTRKKAASRKARTTGTKRKAKRTGGRAAKRPQARALPKLPPPAAAGPQSGYYRTPTIHGDKLIFCSDDDLWIVGGEGGIARRLTASKGPIGRSILSPDGRWITFVGYDEGVSEIYVMPSEGGEATRLTHLASMALPVGWSQDSREVIFASDTGGHFMANHHLFTIPVDGGPHRPLNVGPARALTYEAAGKGVAIGRNGGDPARWKRYRGGMAGSIWVDRRGNGKFRQILKDLTGNLASPMWIGKRIYFVSDHEGIGNIYSCTPDGKGLKRHTDHDDFYARFPSTDGRRIVYHAGADIYVYDTQTGQGRLVPIEIRTPRPQRQRKFASGGAYLEDYDPHPEGHSIALTVRGRPVVMGLWEGPATEFGVPWRGRHRLTRWLNDGKRIVAVTDQEGEEQLEIFTPGQGAGGWRVARLDLGADLGRIIDLVVAPAPPKPPEPGKDNTETAEETGKGGGGKLATRIAKKAAKKLAKKLAKKAAKGSQAGAKTKPLPDLIAITNHRQEIWIIDLTKKSARLVDKSKNFRILGLSWSHDARWIAYGFAVGRRHQAIRIAEVATGKWRQVTSGDFLDYAPCFDPEGKYLYFLSMRTYDPVYEMIQFNLGFPRSVRPYMITLREDEPSPFMPAPRPLGSATKPGQLLGKNPWEIDEATQEETAGPAKKKTTKKPEPVRIDFDGIANRVLTFPVSEGRYFDIDAIPGKVFFLSRPIEGSLGMHWSEADAPAKATIEVYDLRELKQATLVSGVSDFTIARDRKTLIYRSKKRLRAILAGTEPGKAPSESEHGRKSGWIDLGRVRCSIDPGTEWRQMFAEAWRLQRDQFWVPDMSRINWERIYDRYLPLVDRASTRGEFSDLIWEMQGELGTSHCYEIGGDHRRPPNYPVGLLGADLVFDTGEGAWKVAAIPRGDPWDPRQSSPLAAPGLRIRPGAIIHAINGRAVGRDVSPMECLVHLAGQEIWLTISDPDDGRHAKQRKTGTRGRAKSRRRKTRTVTVKTLGSEYALRYRSWVESNRARVHQQSKGRIGYLHIPNMGPQGYSEFHRYFLAEIDREALIVDVRNNGGGHVSQLLLEKLLRKRIAWDVSRHMAPEPYPSEAPRGPMVALTNELAGSDGDIFSHCWKIYGMGPLIGKRTWGGVVGIWPRHLLVDGTITTQPEFSFWFKDVGWGIENYGTDPDIEVDFPPQDYTAGKDPQLERGLQEVAKLLLKFKEELPDMKRRPSRALPRSLKRGRK